MKTFCLNGQKDWDDGICMLLFVVREVFQEFLSLLLLMILVYYIMWSILGISLQEHVKQKQWYAKDAMIREVKPGEEVFVLLFIHCLPLQAKQCWPYVIESRLNELIYIVNTPTRRKKSQIWQVTTQSFRKNIN